MDLDVIRPLLISISVAQGLSHRFCYEMHITEAEAGTVGICIRRSTVSVPGIRFALHG